MPSQRLMRNACLLLLLGLAGQAAAQAWPSRPIRWIVPFAAGGSADVSSRLVGARMAQALGQPVVIENRTGAGGVIGLDFVVKSPADGYTVGLGTPGPFTVNVHFGKLPFDPLKDLQPVVRLAIAPMTIAVSTQLPVTSIAEFIAYARANPGKLSYGSPGVGGLQHLAAEQFKLLAGIDMSHTPYKGGAPAAIDLASGVLPVLVTDVTTVLNYHRAGKVRILGVTSAQRTVSAPELPTVADQGFPGYSAVGWFGLFGPAGLPAVAVHRLEAEAVRALQQPDIREKILASGVEPNPGSAEQLDRDMRGENAKWGRLIRDLGIKLD